MAITNNCYELRHPAFIYEGSEDPLKAAVEDAIKDMRIDASVWEISAHWGDEDHKKIVIVIPVGAPTYPEYLATRSSVGALLYTSS